MKTQDWNHKSKRSLTTRSGRYREIRATVMALTCLVLATSVGWAKLLDDFEDASRSDTIWIKKCFFGTCEQVVTNGVVSLAVTPSGDHGFSYLWSRERWTLQEGKTLEFRADLVSSSGDGAMGYIAFALGDELRMYTLSMDQDTIALWKRANPLQLWHFENARPRKVNNVKLVLSMTGIRSDVRLQFRVLDNDHGGAVLFEREFWDTPQKDPMARGDDTPAGNFLNQSGLFEMSVYHDNANLLDPETGIGPRDRAEVVFDNAEVLEYDAAWIDPPSNAVLVSWPENTSEEQIVVGADVVEGPYAPLPEPIFKRQGRVSLAVEKTKARQFLTLVPGTQFIDDFSEPVHPFASRSPWRVSPPPPTPMRDLWPSNGVLQVEWPTPASAMFMAFPPEPEVKIGNSYSSIDILQWEAPTTDSSYFALAPRLLGDIEDLVYGGGVMLALNHPSTGKISLATTYAGDTRFGPPFDIDTYPPPYRLECSIVGTSYTCRVIHLPTQTQIHNFTQNYQQPTRGLFVGLFFEAAGGGVLGSHRITLDNFFVTGTNP